MCTFHDRAAVTVCDIAIGRVRSDLEDAFPGAVRLTHLEGAGTLVEADGALEPGRFDTVVRAAIAEAQKGPGDDSAPPTPQSDGRPEGETPIGRPELPA